MSTPLTLDTDRRDDGSLVLSATGEIDLSNIDTFTRAMDTAAQSVGDGVAITIDLSAVKYIDSAGINALFTQADRVDGLKVIAHPFLMPVFNISGFSELANVEPGPVKAAEDGHA